MADNIRLEFINIRHPLYEGERQLRYDILLSTAGLPKYSFEHMDADSYHLVAVEDYGTSSAVVGCVLFHPSNERRRTGRLFQMAVAKTKQGLGLGQRLIRTLETKLVEDGFFTVTLHARAHAVSFYERCGYSCFSQPFEEVGIQHRHMRRTIKQVRAIAFDCGGVISPNNDYTYLMQSVGPEKAKAARAAIDVEWDKMKLSRDYTAQMFWTNVLTAVGLNPSDWEKFDRALLDAQRVYWGPLAIVDRLVTKYNGLSKDAPRVVVGIISNFNHSWFANIFQKFGLYQLFTEPSLVVVSCDVQCAKPDAAIYDIFVQRVNAHLGPGEPQPVSPDTVVLIDDKLRNTAAAKGSGLIDVLFNAEEDPSGLLVTLLEELGVLVAEPGYEPSIP